VKCGLTTRTRSGCFLSEARPHRHFGSRAACNAYVVSGPDLRPFITQSHPAMKSRASLKSHPIHPMLIPFPIAFLVGAFAADLVAWTGAVPELAGIGGYLALAGVLTGVAAAIPGFVDYVYTIPPNSSGKRRATKHMAVNLGAVALFALVIVLRGGPEGEAGGMLLLIELVALGLLAAGGWMGGTLVYRNEIGVDRRYAGAGKWKEERVEPDDGRVAVGRADELEVDQMKLMHVDGRRIVLARSEEGLVAFDDHCTHRGGSLAGGSMICGTVQCPWHGSQFDVRSGSVKAGPAEKGIVTYAVEEREGEAFVIL
jgi:nitrite reductase/ring-hydroxylating ferredoxin subunit/uncharacterized membrane protein